MSCFAVSSSKLLTEFLTPLTLLYSSICFYLKINQLSSFIYQWSNYNLETAKENITMEGKSEFVTLDVVKQLLEIQDGTYRNTIKIFLEDRRTETRTIRKDVEALKSSLEFSQGEIDDVKKDVEVEKKKLEHIEDRLKYVESCTEEAYQLEERFDNLELKQEYLENMSHRNNIKILDLPESKEEKTWDDTENLVKQTIKKTLKIDDEVQIERAHCLGKEKMEQK